VNLENIRPRRNGAASRDRLVGSLLVAIAIVLVSIHASRNPLRTLLSEKSKTDSQMNTGSRIRSSFKRQVVEPLRRMLIIGPPASLKGKIPKPLRKVYWNTAFPPSLKKKIPERLRKIYCDIRAELLSIGLPRAAAFTQPEREIQASRDMSIIVPVKDAPATTARCLRSLERFASRAEVIIVDDGSELRSTAAVLEEFCARNGWAFIRHERPTGHSRACEAGARIATRPYLCLLNSDTVVTPWSWWAAKEAFESDHQIAVTGPSTSWSATPQTIIRAKHCRHYWNDSQICAFAKEYVAALRPRSWVDLPEVGGQAFFIRRDLWQRLGGFDPNLPHYGNEDELCMRIVKLGMRIVWTENSYIHHLGAQSYGDEGLSVRSRRAREYINKKHNVTPVGHA
jgi:GT2 family glycosyltransferase